MTPLENERGPIAKIAAVSLEGGGNRTLQGLIEARVGTGPAGRGPLRGKRLAQGRLKQYRLAVPAPLGVPYEREDRVTPDQQSLVPDTVPSAGADLVRAYQDDIERFTQSDQIHLAVQRLLDFAKDFAPERILYNRAIDVARQWNELRQRQRIEGITPAVSGERSKLVMKLLGLKDDLVAAVEGRPDVDEIEIPPPPLRLVPDQGGDQKPAQPEEPDEDSVFETDLDRARRRFLRVRKKSGDEDVGVVFRGVGVSKRYKRGFRDFGLNGINLELHAGQITGLVGVNGSGKTTLMQIVRGALRADGGQIEYPELTRENSSWEHIRRQIAWVPQHLPSWPGYVVDNLHLRAAQFGVRGKKNIDEVEWLLHRLDLADFRRARWNDLSGGYRMRFALARALLSSPRLLVLDEPLAHLDILAQQLFLRDLKAISLSSERPLPVLMSSQHLYEVESLADQLLFLNNGRVVFQGALKDLERNRSANYVELTSDMSRDDLKRVLAGMGDVRVEPVGLYNLITLPLESPVEDALKRLADNGARFRYFRDISGSTVTLFRTQVDRPNE